MTHEHITAADLNSVGKRLRFIRNTIFRCSQSEFAAMAGISASTYTKNESDHLALGRSTLRKIRRLVNLPEDWIMEGSGSLPDELQKNRNFTKNAGASHAAECAIPDTYLDEIIELARNQELLSLAKHISDSCGMSCDQALAALILEKMKLKREQN